MRPLGAPREPGFALVPSSQQSPAKPAQGLALPQALVLSLLFYSVDVRMQGMWGTGVRGWVLVRRRECAVPTVQS